MRGRGANGLLAVVALIVTSGVAGAQTRGSDEVYERANRFRHRHRDGRALDLLRAHFQATHELRALASMGLAEMAMGNWSDAERHLSDALAMPTTPWADANRAALEGALQQCRARLGVAALLVRSDVAGAEVYVNGARVGEAGRAIRVSAGALAFEVRAPGHRAVTRTVTAAPGATVAEQVALEPEQRAPDVSVAPAPVVAAPPVALVAPTPPAPVAPTPPAPVTVGPGVDGTDNTLRTLAWTSAAGAAIFLGVGAGTYVVGLNAADRWNSDACLSPDRNRGDVCPDDRSTASTMGVLATVGFVTGGALAVASAVLLGVSASSRRPAHAAVRCGVGPGWTAACAGEF